MRYETTLGRMAKGICPACERAVNYQDEALAHCPHCGIQVATRCTSCSRRKNLYTRFCFACGTPGSVSLPD
jgi:predicted RNA-binding Zn-ribbon protein involved in translation (DUF1610 family)